MKNVMLKKENGVVSKYTRIKLVSPRVYLVKDEVCFTDILNKDVDFDAKDINSVQNIVTNMITGSLKLSVDNINELYTLLKNASTKQDLVDIVNLLQTDYYNYITERKHKKDAAIAEIRKFSDLLKDKFDLVLSIIIKKIIITYYDIVLSSLSSEQINELEILKLSGVSFNELFNIIGEDFSEVAKKNGVYAFSERICSDTIDKIYDEINPHLCWEDCKCAVDCSCPKVLDVRKRRIDDYKFITDGYQVFDKNGKVSTFSVTGCSRYKKYERVKNDKKTLFLRESILTTFFEAEDAEEAHHIQETLIKNGQLIEDKYVKIKK